MELAGITGVFPRIGAIVVAIILIIVSAATIGVINNNAYLQDVLDFDTDGLDDDGKALQGLILLSNAAAGWLIALNIGIIIAEIIAIILVIVNLEGTGKLVIGILEIIFSILASLCYLATGIACASYAAAWGEPPEYCEALEDNPFNVDDLSCDYEALTATNVLEAVFCFVQIGVFGLIIFMTILGIMKSRSQTA